MATDRSTKADLAVVIAALVTLNLLSGLLLEGWVQATTQVLATAFLVLFAFRRGYSPTELGLAADDAPAGARVGAIAAAAVLVVVVLVALVPFTRGFFDDDRFLDVSRAGMVYETAFRIPVITALTEELLFRSVLLGILLVMTSRWRAVLWSALLFGLWHVLTTIGDIGGNDVAEDFTRWQTALGVIGVVVTTGIGGAVFAWLRIRSGSIVAPWLVHSVLNAGIFLAGYIVVTGGHT